MLDQRQKRNRAIRRSRHSKVLVGKTYLILVFLKTGLKIRNLRIAPADFAKHTFLELTLQRLLLWQVGRKFGIFHTVVFTNMS